MNRLKSYYHVPKHSTLHLLGVNPRLTSVHCMLRCAHSPLNINKKSYRICVCSDIETEIHFFFHCNCHDAARVILCNKFCNILTDTNLAEQCDCLSKVSCCVHSYLVRLMHQYKSRWLSFDPQMSSSNLTVGFDYTLVTTCVIHVFRAFLFYFAYISLSWQDKIA